MTHEEIQNLLIELKEKHEKLQEGLEPNNFCVKEGIVLTICENSRFPFEFFTHRSPEMVLEMDCFIKYAKGRKCFLDIGALHGIFSMVFTELNEDSKAYAFEPSHHAFDILKHNADNSKNVKAFKRAISDDYGVLIMKEEWDHYVISTKEEDGHIVKCLSGDTFCEDIDPVDVIKIDVEGMEFQVLKGLAKTIAENHPIIFLELHNERIINNGGSIKDILDLLENWNYKAIDSRTNRTISFEEIEQVKSGELRLILL